MKKHVVCLIVTCLLMLSTGSAFAHVLIFKPAHGNTLSAREGKLDFVFSSDQLTSMMYACVKDAQGNIVEETQISADKMGWNCSAKRMREGETYTLEVTDGQNTAYADFSISLSGKGNARYRTMSVESANPAEKLLADEYNRVFEEMIVTNGKGSTTSVCDFWYKTQDRDTLLQPILMMWDRDEYFDLMIYLYETKRAWLESDLSSMLGIAASIYEEITAAKGGAEDLSVLPYSPTLSRYISVKDTQSEKNMDVSLGNLEVKTLGYWDVSDHTAALLFCLQEKKSGEPLEDCVYLLSSFLNYGDVAYFCITNHQEKIDEFVQLMGE